jgi:glycosyltransferase involved in cell wall biosynthesis
VIYSGQNKRRIVFVYANDPEPILLERMAALENSGRYEAHAVYWHRVESPLSIPWSSEISEERFHRIDLPDPRGGIARRLFLTFRFALKLRKLLKTLNPDAVTAIYPDMLFAVKAALFGRKSLPVMYELWDVVGAQRPGRISRFVMRKLLSGLRSVFVTADGYSSDYLKTNQLISYETRVVYASNSPANWKFRVPKSRDSARPLTVSFIGQIRVAQQMQYLLGAIEKMHTAGVPIRLLIAGRGEDSEWIESLSKSKVFIDYRGAFDFRRNIEDLYSMTDVMFAMYPQNQFNYRVHWARRAHQAVLSGIPLIVARGSEMGRYVESNRLGWAVSDTSQSELEALLTDLVNNPAKLIEESTDSEAILREHRFETFKEHVIAEYDSLFD